MAYSEKDPILSQQMRQMKIFEKDIKEIFIRSSGSGGQNVNKVSTCVVLYHIPTGIQIKCQQERVQSMNRNAARYILLKKIEELRRKEQREVIDIKEKERRKNRKRSKASKEKILIEKRINSEKKQLRKKNIQDL